MANAIPCTEKSDTHCSVGAWCIWKDKPPAVPPFLAFLHTSGVTARNRVSVEQDDISHMWRCCQHPYASHTSAIGCGCHCTHKCTRCPKATRDSQGTIFRPSDTTHHYRIHSYSAEHHNDVHQQPGKGLLDKTVSFNSLLVYFGCFEGVKKKSAKMPSESGHRRKSNSSILAGHWRPFATREA